MDLAGPKIVGGVVAPRPCLHRLLTIGPENIIVGEWPTVVEMGLADGLYGSYTDSMVAGTVVTEALGPPARSPHMTTSLIWGKKFLRNLRRC